MLELSKPKNGNFKFKILQQIARRTRNHQLPYSLVDRLLRLIYHPDKRHDDYFDIVMEYDRRLLININSSIFLEWSVFFYGYYEPEVVRVIKRVLKPSGVVFDIGANIGCHTLIMGYLVGGDVVSVEPHPKTFERLMSNIELNNLINVKPLRCVFGDFSDKLNLFSTDTGDLGGASLCENNVNNRKFQTQVSVTTLDEVMKCENYDRLDLIKIDTEGYEQKILKGGEDSIHKYRPYIIFEYDERTWENAGGKIMSMEKYFEGMKYNLYVIHYGGYLTKIEYGIPESVNILAIPR